MIHFQYCKIIFSLLYYNKTNYNYLGDYYEVAANVHGAANEHYSITYSSTTLNIWFRCVCVYVCGLYIAKQKHHCVYFIIESKMLASHLAHSKYYAYKADSVVSFAILNQDHHQETVF